MSERSRRSAESSQACERGRTEVERFGSVRRMGVESTEYQLDRLRRLNDFHARLLAAYQRRLAQQQRQSREVFDGNRWLETQRAAWERESQARAEALERRQRDMEELNRGREWLASQQENLIQTSQQQEAAIAELKAWLAEVERSRDWAESQRLELTAAVARYEEAARAMREWQAELQKGKDWHEQQARNWQETAERQGKLIEELEASRNWNAARREQLERAYDEWQRRLVPRVLRRVGLLKAINGAQAAHPEAGR